MEQKTLLACRDVSLGYEGRAVWEHLNLEIRSGEYLCIVGENGSGKSTLLKSLLGLIKPLRGSIELDPSLRSGAIGYLPQQTRAQKDFPATVSEVVLSGFLSARGRRFFYTPAEKSRALMNLGKLGILELKDRCYRELSGGARPGRRAGPVPHARLPQQDRGHRHRHGDPRHPQRPALCYAHSPRGTGPVVQRERGGISRFALRQAIRR